MARFPGGLRPTSNASRNVQPTAEPRSAARKPGLDFANAGPSRRKKGRLASRRSGGGEPRPRAVTRGTHGQRGNRPEAGPRPPADALGGHGQFEAGPAFDEGGQRALGFDAGELVTQAKMDARPER